MDQFLLIASLVCFIVAAVSMVVKQLGQFAVGLIALGLAFWVGTALTP